MDEPGRLLGRGRTADVYEAGPGRALRRYRDGRDQSDEAETMTYLRRHGYPVPEVFAVRGADMLLERVDGPTMLRALARRPWRARGYARALAELHDRLHLIPPRPGLPDGPGPRDAVLHLDLHPGNVLLSPAGPVVIDWANAAAGPAGADIAQSVVLMTTSDKDPHPVRRFLFAVLLRAFLRAFLAAAHADPGPHLEAVARARSADPNVTPTEAARLAELVAASAAARSAATRPS